MPSLTTATTLLKLTSLLLLLAANPANAIGCFKRGVAWSPGTAASFISTACNALAGTYNYSTYKTNCQDMSHSYHADFKITLETFENPEFVSHEKFISDSESISVKDCIAQNSEIAARCPGIGGIWAWRGGIRQPGYHWLLEFDPNSGICYR